MSNFCKMKYFGPYIKYNLSGKSVKNINQCTEVNKL